MSICSIHDGLEPIGEASTVCPECGHVYLSDLEILLVFRACIGTALDGPPPFCPLCLHDWYL